MIAATADIPSIRKRSSSDRSERSPPTYLWKGGRRVRLAADSQCGKRTIAIDPMQLEEFRAWRIGTSFGVETAREPTLFQRRDRQTVIGVGFAVRIAEWPPPLR